MTAAALYDTALAVHVVTVIAAFGVLFVWPLLPAGTAAAHHQRARILSWVSRIAGISLLAGLYMATDRDLFAEVWVTIPLTIMFVVLGLLGALMTPAERRLAVALASEGDAEGSLARRANLVAIGCSALVAVAAVVMVLKP